jgi:glycosyltransferase involved in cell wall biosynthesis
MQVLALVQSPKHVCARYRLRAFAGALSEAGAALSVEPLARNCIVRVRQLRAARRADVVILQRKLLPRWQLAILRHSARRLVYDFDDAVYRRDSFSRKPPESRSRMRRFRATIAAADVVIAGNHFLAKQASMFGERALVHVIPTCVDARRYPQAAHQRIGGDCRLAWIGQRSTLGYLSRAKPILELVAGELAGLRLRVISNAFPSDCGMAIERRLWSASTEAADLAGADIGIAWLPDDEWSRGKCGLKVLQYMGAGLPVVADAVGVHREMIVDGQTGFLVTEPGEWAERISALARAPELRRRMGRQARERVCAGWGVDRWAPRFVSLLREAHAGACGAADAEPAELSSQPLEPLQGWRRAA